MDVKDAPTNQAPPEAFDRTGSQQLWNCDHSRYMCANAAVLKARIRNA